MRRHAWNPPFASKRRFFLAAAAILTLAGVSGGVGGVATEPPPAEPASNRLALNDAPPLERQALEALRGTDHWMPRAVAAMRLDRFDCDASRDLLVSMLHDNAWQVRAFAIRTLGRRAEAPDDNWFAEEHHPRVIRAMVRHGYTLETDRLGRGVRALARSSNLDEMMLAAEIGANCVEDTDLQQLARDAARSVALRMNRVQAGILSPRLAALTDGIDRRERYEWQRYVHKTGRRFDVQPWRGAPGDGVPVRMSRIAQLEPEAFAQLDRYLREMSERRLDLVVVIDATGSMSSVFHQTLGAVDDLLLAARDLTASFRSGLVAYRDRRQDFETRVWGFATPLDEIRAQMWVQEADQGGTTTESVLAGLQRAYGEMPWMPSHEKVVVLIGDGPPHVGEGALCVDLAERAKAQLDVVTHAVQPRSEAVKHFADIADAGGGRVADLDSFIPLVRDILGLPAGDSFDAEFRELLLTYYQLCR